MLDGRPQIRIGRALFPWLVLATVFGLAVWHVLDFSEARDLEFPRVTRPFFNAWPPAAYRLAEPGDTLDRVGLYLGSTATMLALLAVVARLRPRADQPMGLWPTALALALAATWHASTPGPTFDGWHGLGWRVILDDSAPALTRVAVGLGALILASLVVANLAQGWRLLLDRCRGRGFRGLLVTSAVLVGLRQWSFDRIEPAGYWPRCSFDLGLLAFVLAMIRARPWVDRDWFAWPTWTAGLTGGLLVILGVGVMTYHRPLSRLHAVVPGRIYISAMPTYRGLAIEQDRLHFRTIINLFDEASTQASPYHADEIRFIREHNLRYLGSPSDGLESDRFLDETLALAQDPDAWPILVHCHGCMDRSPAWMGIYRFLVQGEPLDAILGEIERHRGSRPKPVVTLQYNRKLPARAPQRYATDPTAQLLLKSAIGTEDPFLRPQWNPTATDRKVVTRIDPEPSEARP